MGSRHLAGMGDLIKMELPSKTEIYYSSYNQSTCCLPSMLASLNLQGTHDIVLSLWHTKENGQNIWKSYSNASGCDDKQDLLQNSGKVEIRLKDRAQ